MKKNYILLLVFLVSTLSLHAQLQYAICFDGVNDFAPIYRSTETGIFGTNANNDSFTIEFWAKDNNNGGKYYYSKHYDSGTAKEGYFIEKNSSGTVTVGIANTSNTWSTIVGTRSVNDSDWHHIAFTFDFNTNVIRLYVDGVPDGVNSGFTAVFGNTVDARLASSEHENSFFGGSFDEVKIWNTVKTATEINNFKNLPLDTGALPSDLILYYQCNEGIPDTDNWILYQLVDHTGNGRPGDLWNVFRLGTCSNWVHSVPGTTLSTETFEADTTKLALYPNPATNSIQLSGLKVNESYAIYNTLGAIVKRGTIANNEAIAIENLTSGLYFLRLKDNRTLKFIKK